MNYTLHDEPDEPDETHRTKLDDEPDDKDCKTKIEDLFKEIDKVGENLKENNEDIEDIKVFFDGGDLYFTHRDVTFCDILDFYKILFHLLNKQYKGKTFGLFGRNKTKLKNRIEVIKDHLKHNFPEEYIKTNRAKTYLKEIIKESNSKSKKGGKTRKSITKTHRKGRKTYRKGRKSNTKTHRKGKKTHRKTRKTN